MINGLSMFSNVGISELMLEEVGIKIKVANELIEKRADIYKHIYPDVEMVVGDISDDKIYNNLIEKAKKYNCKFIIATPPCQGMSVAGKREEFDVRNQLVTYVLDAIDELNPDNVLIENVVQQLNTDILYEGETINILKLIEDRTRGRYYINEDKILDMKYYGIPQSRKRSFILLSKVGQWEFPMKNKKTINLKEAIGHLPSFEAIPREKEIIMPNNYEKIKLAMKFHKYHKPRIHPWRHIEAMMHTPSGETAFNNEIHYPKRQDGKKVKGYNTAYRRMDWLKPAPTITTVSGAISSQTNVHPGRKNKDGTFSDARALSIYELMILMTIPDNWNLPENLTDTFIREIIGEGIPPLMIKKLIKNMPRNKEDDINVEIPPTCE